MSICRPHGTACPVSLPLILPLPEPLFSHEQQIAGMRLPYIKDTHEKPAADVSQGTNFYPTSVENIRKSEYPLLEGLCPLMHTKAIINAETLQKQRTSIMQEQPHSLDLL